MAAQSDGERELFDIFEEERTTPNLLALLVLPLLSAVGLIGNALVCVAIASERRLHNVTNYFLLSLALADLLVCCVVMPLAILVELQHGKWMWSFSLCLLYVYADVFLCSASIVHMSVISLDRYLGISRPLHQRRRSRSAILIKIVVVWLVTLLISSPLALIALDDHENVLQGNSCAVFNRYYMIYGSTFAFLVPFVVMTITYILTTRLLNKQAKLLSVQANDRANGGLRRTTVPHRKLGLVARTSSGAGTAAIIGAVSAVISTNPSATGGGVVAATPAVAVAVHAATGVSPQTTPPSTRSNANGRQKSSENSIPESENQWAAVKIAISDASRTSRPGSANGNGNGTTTVLAKRFTLNSQLDRLRNRTSTYFSALAGRMGRRSSLQQASQELANEHKATRVLAVVFVCFFCCWTPFFVTNFVLGFCGAACTAPPWMESLFLWLGYVSSTINPLIYTVFNRRFRQAFARILRCRCLGKRRRSGGPTCALGPTRNNTDYSSYYNNNNNNSRQQTVVPTPQEQRKNHQSHSNHTTPTAAAQQTAAAQKWRTTSSPAGTTNGGGGAAPLAIVESTSSANYTIGGEYWNRSEEDVQQRSSPIAIHKLRGKNKSCTPPPPDPCPATTVPDRPVLLIDDSSSESIDNHHSQHPARLMVPLSPPSPRVPASLSWGHNDSNHYLRPISTSPTLAATTTTRSTTTRRSSNLERGTRENHLASEVENLIGALDSRRTSSSASRRRGKRKTNKGGDNPPRRPSCSVRGDPSSTSCSLSSDDDDEARQQRRSLLHSHHRVRRQHDEVLDGGDDMRVSGGCTG